MNPPSSPEQDPSDLHRLPSLFEAFPLGIMLADADGQILEVNAESERLLGLSCQEHLGRTLGDPIWRVVRPDGSPMPPEEFASVRAQKEGQKVSGVIMGVIRPDQEIIWLDVTASPLPDGKVIVTYADISERHRDKAILEARSRLVERAPELSLEGLLQAILDEAERLTNSCIGFYHFVDADQVNLKLQAWSTRTEKEFCRAEGKGLHYPIQQAGVWADCLREQKPVIHNDYASLPHRQGTPPGHARIIRELTVPVFRHGRVVAILGVGNKPAPYHDQDVESVQRLADLAWDLAERKRTETALQDSLHTSDEIVRAIPSGLFIYQFKEPDQLILLSGNPKAEQLTGLKVQNLIGLEFNQIYPKAKEIGLTEKFINVIRTGQEYDTEDTVYQDERIAGAFRIRVFCLPGQRLAVGFENITAMKIAVQELADTKATMEAAFAGTEIPIAMVSAPDAVVLIINRACLEYLGIQDEPSYLGKSLLDYKPSWKDFDAQGNPVPFRELPLAKALRGESIHGLEMKTIRKDGTVRWNLASACPIHNAKGKLIAGFLAFPDITERKLAEAEHQRFQEQLQQIQKMESLGSLASGVAHDMNNVLGAILGLASLCREDQPEGSRFAKAMDTITTACERGRTMVQSLLGFARKSLAEKRVLNLNALVEEEITLLEHTTLAKLSLRMELASNLRPMDGDPSALSQAIMNLCVNAMDAMHEGGTLTLRTRNEDPDQILLEVEDNGSGMSPEVLARAMDPFFTTKPQGKGTGLGLAMVYGCIKAHGGNLEIQSEPGKGTKVLMHFPASEVLMPEPATEPSHTNADLTPLTLLLVDDDELIRASMEMAFQAMGCESVITGSGEEALERLEGGLHPDLVILDMNMPGLGGAGTLPRLRELNAVVPILLATGRADQSAQKLATAYPGVYLLAKPFTLAQLRDYIDQLVKPA